MSSSVRRTPRSLNEQHTRGVRLARRWAFPFALLCASLVRCASDDPAAGSSGTPAGGRAGSAGSATSTGGAGGSGAGGASATTGGGASAGDSAGAGQAGDGNASSGSAGQGGSTAGAGGSHAGSAGSDAGSGGIDALDARAGAGGSLREGGVDAGRDGSAGGGGIGPLPEAGSGPITVWLAGDSTVAATSPCPVGWGGQFDAYFDSRVTVADRARGGRSVRTWLYNVLTTMDSSGECKLTKDASGNPVINDDWKAMLTGMKSGDYLMIQFGINDGASTCNRHVGLAAFKESYGMMAKAAKDRGAHPIFLTPVSSIACTGSVAHGTRGSFATATKEAGVTYDVPVIDLETLSVALYNSRGFCPIPGGGDITASTGGAVGQFFCNDHTHFDTGAAKTIAGLVAKALRDQSLGLAAYLNATTP